MITYVGTKVNCTGHERCPYRDATGRPLVARSECSQGSLLAHFLCRSFRNSRMLETVIFLCEKSVRERGAIYRCHYLIGIPLSETAACVSAVLHASVAKQIQCNYVEFRAKLTVLIRAHFSLGWMVVTIRDDVNEFECV